MLRSGVGISISDSHIHHDDLRSKQRFKGIARGFFQVVVCIPKRNANITEAPLRLDEIFGQVSRFSTPGASRVIFLHILIPIIYPVKTCALVDFFCTVGASNQQIHALCMMENSTLTVNQFQAMRFQVTLIGPPFLAVKNRGNIGFESVALLSTGSNTI
jgi:hypothetical protein